MFRTCGSSNIVVPPQTKGTIPVDIAARKSLVFSDEFTGNSLDYSKWRTSHLWGPDTIINNEEQYYLDTANGDTGGINPFTFDGDNLIITAHHTPGGGSGTEVTQKDFTSGIITTADSFLIYPGDYVEVCARMPCGVQGFWGAIWLLTRYYPPNQLSTGANGKFAPEIDWEFVEGTGGAFGGGPYSTQCALAAYHYDDGACKIDVNGFGCRNPTTGAFDVPAVTFDCEGNLLGTNFNPPAGFDYICDRGDTCAEFHTYGWNWENDKLEYYMDGVITHSICDNNIVSQVPMYLLINQAVGGGFPGPADPADYPSSMIVDYARVYR